MPRSFPSRAGTLSCLLVLTPAAALSRPDDGRLGAMPESYGRLPIRFEENRGQTSDDVRLLSRGNGYTLFLTPAEAVLVLQQPEAPARKPRPDFALSAVSPEPRATRQAVVRMRFMGAAARPRVTGEDPKPGTTNYFVGNDPDRWLTNVPTCGRVRYSSIYPGIDLVYHGTQRELEYDLEVAPGADPEAVSIRFDGAGTPRVDPSGRLILSTSGSEVVLRAPSAWQEGASGRTAVACAYAIDADGRVRFRLGGVDPRRPLTIDPVIEYSTYLGGIGLERGLGIAADAAGQAYLTGWTNSPDFPTAEARQPSIGGNVDAYVVKLNSDGTDFVFSTYLGGTMGLFGEAGDEYALGGGIALDPDGNIYVTGTTGSTDFPVTPDALKSTLAGFSDKDAFLTKLDPTGTDLLYSTYLGGGYVEEGTDVAVDAAGNAYVTGLTLSTDFPTENEFQSNYAGDWDTFVSKINTLTGDLVYSTYLGSDRWDWGVGIAIDAAGCAYVTGQTGSPMFPTTAGAFQTDFTGVAEAFVVRFIPSGSDLAYSTLLGGQFEDMGMGVAVDGSGRAFVTGGTFSPDFPMVNAWDGSHNGGLDAFVAAVEPDGADLAFSTYLGGGENFFCGSEDVGTGIALGPSGQIHVTGFTSSCDFPTVNPLQCGGNAGQSDAFVAVFDAMASNLIFSTYLGGSAREHQNGYNTVFSDGDIAVDPAGRTYIIGYTESDDFMVRNAKQPDFGGFGDAFVARIALEGGEDAACDLVVTQTESSDPTIVGNSLSYSLTVRNLGPSCAGNVMVRDLYPPATFFTYASSSTGSCYDSSGTVVCTLGTLHPGDVASITVNLQTTVIGQVENLAWGTTTTPDIDPENNSSLESTAIITAPSADLEVTQTHVPEVASVGHAITFVYRVINHGPDAAAAAGLYHESGGVTHTIEEVNSSRGTCELFDYYAVCSFGDLEPGDSAVVEVVVIPGEVGTLGSYANAFSSTGDEHYEDNSTSEQLDVLLPPEELLSGLRDRILTYGLNKGHERNLLSRLQSARDALAAGDVAGACSDLDAFRRRVATFAGRSLTVVQAHELDSGADQIQAILECLHVAGLTAAAPEPGADPGTVFSFEPLPGAGELTQARLTLPAAGHVRVDVFDVRGRRVGTVLDAELSAGVHDVDWDGHGSDGERVPAGMYFLRVATDARSAVVRTIRLH